MAVPDYSKPLVNRFVLGLLAGIGATASGAGMEVQRSGPLLEPVVGATALLPDAMPTARASATPAQDASPVWGLHLPRAIAKTAVARESIETVFGDALPGWSVGGVPHENPDERTDTLLVTPPLVSPGSPATSLTKAEEAPNPSGSGSATSSAVVADALPREGAKVTNVPASPSVDTVTKPSPPVVRPPMPPQVRSLRVPLERCLKQHEQIRLNTKDDGCWSIMHSFLGWGPTTEVHVGGPRGTRVNAIQWLTQNQPCAGRPLFYLADDRLRGREGPGFQGHPAQFLAMLAQTGIDSNYPIKVGSRSFTVRDLVAEEQRTCSQETELTFKLIGLSYYTSTDAQWKNERGEDWNFPRVVEIELAQPVNGAACGGTHRLMGLTFSLAQRKREGLPIQGHWWRAERYIEDYQKYILTLQNRDGSFSSDWFKKKSDWGDMDRRVQTTGHMLEWLVYSLPEDGLYHPQVVSAVNYLTNAFTQHRFHEWEVGPKGHAIRALRLYYSRVFQPPTDSSAPVANRGGSAGVK